MCMPIIPVLNYKFLKLKLQYISMWQVLGSNCLKPDILKEEYVLNHHNWNKTKTKPIQPICWKHIHIQPILFKWVSPLVLFLSQYVEKIYIYIHIQPILFKWVGPLVLKAYHTDDLNSKNVQSLISMGKDRSFGNIFWW